MRKVYHTEKSSAVLAISVMISAAMTLGLFAFLPFAHQVVKPDRSLELRKASVADLPPPVEEEPPAPPPDTDKPPETPPDPQLSEAPQQIALNTDLDVAVGSGGTLAGFGEAQRLTTMEAVQETTFDVADLEKRPEAVSQVPPTYPSELRKAKIEGSVTLVFVLNEEGRVEEARVENSSRAEFEKPALDALKRWRFKPEKDGVAVKAYMRLPMRFRVVN
jgi:protein TonB